MWSSSSVTKHGKERWIWSNKKITGTDKYFYYSLATDEKTVLQEVGVSRLKSYL